MSAELQQINKDSNDPPLLAVFPSGIPNAVADEEAFPFQHFVNEDKKKQNKGSFLFGEDTHLRFIGSTHEEYNLSKNNFNYAIGYYQPTSKNKKVKLVQAYGVFNMRQVQLGSGEIDDGSKREIDFAAQRKDLTEMFGSRKRKRQLRSEEAGRINIEQDEAALQALHTQLNVIEKDDTHAADLEKSAQGKMETINKILPKYDAETKNVMDIYSFADILPKELWDAINAPRMLALRLTATNNKVVKKQDDKKKKKKMDDSSSDDDESDNDDDSESSEDELFDENTKVEQDKVENVYTPLTEEEEQRVKALPQFIQQRRAKLQPLILSASATNNVQQMAVIKQRVVQLAMLTVVYRLVKIDRKLLKNKDEFATYLLGAQPNNTKLLMYLKQYFFKTTSPNLSSAYNAEAKFRILCHLTILSLMCGDGMELKKNDIATIANDLTLPPSQIINIYKTVGCTAASEASVKLKAPLKLETAGGSGSQPRRK